MKSIVPLGDQAALVYFEDEDSALHFARAVRLAKYSWLVDVVSSYRSVAVHYDLDQAAFPTVADELSKMDVDTLVGNDPPRKRLHLIPCCYERQLDLSRVVQFTGMSAEEVVRWHVGTDYRVFAIGFCPGFPYLGYLPPPLCGVPRLDTPRVRVEAGSVGLTGLQTGIYTQAKPGGWNLIGRTPLSLVDVAAGYFPLSTGDVVRFVPIDEKEYQRLLGQRLSI